MQGPELALKSLEILDEAASAISDGDLVDAMIHRYAQFGMANELTLTSPIFASSPEQHWSLMPLHAVHSTVRPAAQMYGGCQAFGPGPKVMTFPRCDTLRRNETHGHNIYCSLAGWVKTLNKRN